MLDSPELVASLFDPEVADGFLTWRALEDHWFPRLRIGTVGNSERCGVWNVDTTFDPDGFSLPREIPTLIVTGGFDHVTPPDTGERLDEQLTTSHLVEAPTLTHAPLEALDALFSGCGTSIVEDLLAGSDQASDASCVDMVPDRTRISGWFS